MSGYNKNNNFQNGYPQQNNSSWNGNRPPQNNNGNFQTAGIQNDSNTQERMINNNNGSNNQMYVQKQGIKQQYQNNRGLQDEYDRMNQIDHGNTINNRQYYNQVQKNQQQQQQYGQSRQYGRYNQKVMPNNGVYQMQMWDMNTFQGGQEVQGMDFGNQNFPSLSSALYNQRQIYINQSTNANDKDLEDIPDSQELELRMIEKQKMLQDQSNKGQNKKKQEIKDVTSLFNEMAGIIGDQSIVTDGQFEPFRGNEQDDSRVMVRTKQGVFLMDYNVSSIPDETNKISSWNSYSFFIQEGHYIVNIGVFSTTSKKMLDHRKKNDIQNLIMSPLQKYLICIEKPDNSDNIKCQILDALSLHIYKEFDYNFFSISRTNQILFDKNEGQIFIREKKQINIYETCNFEIVNEVPAENFTHQYLSPSSEAQQLLLLRPEISKGYEMIPAQLKLFNLSDLSTCILNESISKSQEIMPIWSPDGNHLLFWCSTIKDDTGNTYYGQHIIYKFNYDSKTLQQLNFYQGVIHDIKWQPNSEHFVVIGGGMPSHSVLFSKQGIPLFEFGRHHINKVSWNPFSKLLFLGGFGNLGGDIEVWDIARLQKIGQFKAHCTVSSSWSYDGNKILCSVLFPKLRVQNNFKVFECNGQLKKHIDFSNTDLYEVCWQPSFFVSEKKWDQVKTLATQQNTEPSLEESKAADIVPKKGMLTKRGNLSSMLNDQKITNHGGKGLMPNETFAREEDKEMELVKQTTSQKAKEQGIVFSRNKNKFIDQPKPPTEEEEIAIERQRKAEKKSKQQNQFLQKQRNDQEIASQQGQSYPQGSQQQYQIQYQQNQSQDQQNQGYNQYVNQQQNSQQQQQQYSQQNNQQGQYQPPEGQRNDNFMRRNIADIQDKRKSSGKGSSEGGRCSPEFDDFFDQTDEVNEKDRLNIQAIEKKSE